MDDVIPATSLHTGTSPPRALVYTRDENAAGIIRQTMAEMGILDTVLKADTLSTALRDVPNSPSPRLLIIDIDGDPDPVPKLRSLIDACEPSTSVIVIGKDNDIRLFREIRAVGVADYFFKPLVTALLIRSCRAITGGVQESQPNRSAKMIFVVGVRGGCGASTLTVRTALKLSENPPRPVLLLDLDLQFGDIALQLDATPNSALSEALAQSERVDDLFLERGLVKVTGHLDLMASLTYLDAATRFDETALLSLLEKVGQRYRYVVVDVPAAHAPAFVQTLHLPGTLILVSDGRLVSAREVARWYQWLGTKGDDRKVMHILNKNGAHGALSVDDFTKAAGKAPDVLIPFSREVTAQALEGLKVHPDCPPLDRGLDPVIAQVAGKPSEAPWSLKRWLG